MSNNICIAISGKSGCGNTTVSTIIAEKLGFTMINFTFRTLAEELGLSFEELRKKAEADYKYDKMLDGKQLDLASKQNCVLGSRLAVWLKKDADLSVFLTAPEVVRSSRITERESRSIEEVIKETADRDEMDRNRYLDLYGIDNDKYNFVDMVIDTSKYDQYEVSDFVLNEFYKKFPAIKNNH